MTDTPELPVSIADKELCEADPNIIYIQLGTEARAAISARDFVGMHDGLMFAFGADNPKKYWKVIIKLNGKDLYEIEVGYFHRRTFEWHIVSQCSDIDDQALGAVVRDEAGKAVMQ